MSTIPTQRLAAAVLARSEAVEAYQEKLALICVENHQSLSRLLDALPKLEADARAKLMPELTARLDESIPDIINHWADHAWDKLSDAQRGALAEIVAIAQANKDDAAELVRASLAEIQKERQRGISLEEVSAKLTELAEDAANRVARAALAEPEVQAVVQKMLDALPAPEVPAPVQPASFIDIFKGTYSPGSEAKRGEVWTWNGSTYLCTQDTVSYPRPGADGIDPAGWQMLAAAGISPPASVSVSSGGASLPDQTGNSGKFLTTDGSSASWGTPAGAGDLLAANNLSDVAVSATAFANIKQAATEAASGVVELATSAETTAGLAVQASDTRLSDARTPTAHKTSHENGGADEISVAGLSGVLADPQPPIIGAGATQAVAGNDARLTDARTPTDGSVTLAKMANLAQDQFIGRTTASTGVPETATITAAARTVLDDATVGDMVNTLGGATSTGTGGIARATSPTFVTPLLGTPTSGTLTNCTDLPASGIAAGVLGGDITLGETTGQIVLDAALSADGKWSGICEAGTAGAALAFGDLCYFAVADSRWELTDADAAATAGPVKIGICVLAAAGDGSATVMLLWGKVRADAVFPTMTIGAPLYVGLTAGDIAVTETWGTDDVIRIIGHANTADELFFHPSNDYITYV